MLILDENEKTVVIDSINTPIPSEFFWVLDLAMRDFTLAPLLVLEEVSCPTLTLVADGHAINVPANWNVLIYDGTTGDIDIVPVAWIGHKDFTAFAYGVNKTLPRPAPLRLVDYTPYATTVAPALNKHQMLCHPIGVDSWICLSPNDGYAKYLKNTSMGDLIE